MMNVDSMALSLKAKILREEDETEQDARAAKRRLEKAREQGAREYAREMLKKQRQRP